ncbi:hypothetical protein HOP50_03g24280 [Chloropicon primus]|uniref:Uncharacterized protein n=1 Tax=Chloropicon primus TaxID=1764295 RepID=A0A5B8MHZ9_9CHLO|nr:hypothetical protein A3770_03p24290 [Chloropicon primus]UPQ99122.1 hypothetical protein HOP50_03g24280 [Chloropicon primus]|eukprot:QDZ19911.1 hypothetical protein A3770_03p24290 [Chloropicon primus]
MTGKANWCGLPLLGLVWILCLGAACRANETSLADVDCGTDCAGRCGGEVEREVCRSRCEMTRWLSCSSGAGGCEFHGGNGHFESAKARLRHLRAYGLDQGKCLRALHTGELPRSMLQCHQCESTLTEVIEDLASAAQLAVYSDPHILITPKEALLHLQMCACTAESHGRVEPPGENLVVSKFSDHRDLFAGEDDGACLWYGWAEGVSGGEAAYTVSSSLGHFESVLSEYGGRGLHLVSAAQDDGDRWIGWWERMESDSTWIAEESEREFARRLEAAGRMGYVASSITFGAGTWVAWLFRPRGASSPVSSRWAWSGSAADLLGELNAAVEGGERLQAIAHGGGKWITWFTNSEEEVAKSSFILTPLKRDFETFNQRMVEQGYFASAAAFGAGTFVAWFDDAAREDGRSAYLAQTKGLDFVLHLDRALHRDMMVTAMSHGCFGEP